MGGAGQRAMSFGTPGHYGKFFINSKESPVSNDLNYAGSVHIESKTLMGHRGCPSPWLKSAADPQPGVYPCTKPRTEYPIDHPHAGGIRFHESMHSDNGCMHWNPTRLVMEVGDEMSVCVLTKPFKIGYGDSFGISLDVEFLDSEASFFAVGVAPASVKWNRGARATVGGGKCMVKSDGTFLRGDKDGSRPSFWE